MGLPQKKPATYEDLLAVPDHLVGSDDEGWPLLATHGGDAKVRAEPFEAIEVELALLWSR